MKVRDRIKGLQYLLASELVPHPQNWRRHPDAQANALRGVLAEIGFAGAILVRKLDDGRHQILDGHLRAETTPDLKLPCLVTDLTEDEARKLLVSYDPLSTMADADRDLLAALLGTVETENPDLRGLLDRLAADHQIDLGAPGPNAGQTDPDELPEAPEKPITRPGDLWLLDRHRLLCGDCTKTEDVQRLLDRKKAAMCFTDPPWNVAIGTDSNPRHRQRRGLKNDDLEGKDYAALLDGFVKCMIPVVAGDVYCVLGAAEWPTLDLAMRRNDHHWSATIIWVKDIFVLGRSKYHRRYEPIWYGWHHKAKSSFTEARNLDDVWEIKRPRVSEEHPTMKPVELVQRAVENSSVAGDIVYDPFMGSGTTYVACEQTGRTAYGLEIDAVYCDVIVKRWEQFTGKKAERETAKRPARRRKS